VFPEAAGDYFQPEAADRALARELLTQARGAQQQEEAPAEPDQISDALVLHIFADPEAQELL
jgi:hypothetical protein